MFFLFVNTLRLNQHLSDKDKHFLKSCLKHVKTWSNLGPILKPYFLLMKLENSIHQGDFSNFRRYAFDAIDLAVNNKFTLLEAYINERLGQECIERQHEHANYFLKKAITLYQSAGASVKEKQLTELYSISPVKKPERTDQSLSELLDINYLLEATRSITQQIDFNELLSTILQSVMERLGAKTAYILIESNQQLELMARGDKHDYVEVTIKNHGIIATENLSMAIANYVFRTSEMLVINDASEESDFKTDNTVQKQQLKSILCIPLVIKKEVLGVLYLENKLMPSVFTQEQIELTKLLTAQAAVALQNTKLIKDMQQNQREIESLNINLENRVEERTAELNRVNEELNNFAYVVSHDLKAPLRAINQLAGWISEDYGSSFDDEGREQMDLICGRAKRMHEMIDGILQYSRIGRIKEDQEDVNLTALINEVIDLIAPPQNIKIDIVTSFPVVKGERLRLHQVFQNLIDNAIKYNDQEQGLIELSCIENEKDWQIAIKDNGPGIAKKYQEKIFQLFQTLKPKDQSESTGVGLSLIEKTVTNWGGTIWIESEEGQGSMFIFTIPKKNSRLH